MGWVVTKWSRFILRLMLLIIASGALVLSFEFFYPLHLLTIDQFIDLLNIFSSYPLASIGVAIGIILFVLSLLGCIMLIQYPLWRYPLSIFFGYAAGCYIYYHFYLIHPFEENILQLNNDAWYYPLVVATALLLRAVVGFKLPKFKKQVIANS